MDTIIQKGRPPGRRFPSDVRVRLSEELRTGLVLLKEISGISLSEIVRQALTIRLKETVCPRDKSLS